MKRTILLTVTLAGLTSVALAQQQPMCGDPAETVVSLNAEARRQVQQDRIQANLTFEATAKTPAAAQAEVNKRMQAAKGVYDKANGVKVSSGNYNVYRVYDDGQNIPAAEREKNAQWRASQQLVLDGADKEEMIQLVNTLQQQGFAVQGLNYYLSREKADALRDELTAQALTDIRQRAQTMAKSLGLNQIRYARIDAGQANLPGPQPLAFRGKVMMAAEVASAPVVQAGDSEVSVNVNADVRMK